MDSYSCRLWGVGRFNCKNKRSNRIYYYQQQNVDWVKALGADRVIDYKTEDYKVANWILFFDTLGDDYTLMLLKSLKKVEK
jgi:NADPH:quinone reductase-like Zn-dependent oxidoreductase